uniref:PH domain-containing protein n=1 Tax=Steinernema glaseri TaxID=37863 RepID=A0A1I7Z6C0_9BILA
MNDEGDDSLCANARSDLQWVAFLTKKWHLYWRSLDLAHQANYDLRDLEGSVAYVTTKVNFFGKVSPKQVINFATKKKHQSFKKFARPGKVKDEKSQFWILSSPRYRPFTFALKATPPRTKPVRLKAARERAIPRDWKTSLPNCVPLSALGERLSDRGLFPHVESTTVA